MNPVDLTSDAELLERSAREPLAFQTFYRRHERFVLRYLMTRCRDAELTADLAAETFARALELADHFDPIKSGGTTAISWLLVIANNTYASSLRRGVVADDARRRLCFAPLVLRDEDLARIEREASAEVPVDEVLGGLAPSRQVVRKRAPGGLTRWRSALLTVED
jgi:DNA-directed RNA polymerase specialized sigma24 family protein